MKPRESSYGEGGASKARALKDASAMAAGFSCLAALVSAVLLVGATAHGFPEFSFPYTQANDGDCEGNPIDPIGVVFIGDRAGVDGVVHNFGVHDPPYGNTSGSLQKLKRKIDNNPDEYRCHTHDAQRGTGEHERHHVRLWFIPASSGATKRTVGSPHYEDWVHWSPANNCGTPPFGSAHAVEKTSPDGSGFDRGRRRIHNQFEDANHIVDTSYWGNTSARPQCDGDYAASNGNGAHINVNHLH